MEQENAQLTKQEQELKQEEQIKKQKDFEDMLASAKKWGQWRNELYATKICTIEMVAQPQLCENYKFAIPTIRFAPPIPIQSYEDDDDNEDDPLAQYMRGERDDIEVILNAADKKEKEQRS
jgi:hypothetical protein